MGCSGFKSSEGTIPSSQIPLPSPTPSPTRLTKLDGVTEIAKADLNNFCVLRYSRNSYKHHVVCIQYGIGPKTNGSYRANLVENLPASITSISGSSADDHFGCALSGGKIYCWGKYPGRTTDSSSKNYYTAEQIPGISEVEKLFTPGARVCYIKQHRLYCWGKSPLGDGTSQDSDIPVQVLTIWNPVKVIPEYLSRGAVVLTQYHGAWRWANFSAELAPQRITEVTEEFHKDITGSSMHTCLIDQDRALKCWGANDRGQLGDSTTTNRAQPTQVQGLTAGITSVSAGRYDFTCALNSARQVYCWGANGYGQLGNGTKSDSLVPQWVSSLNNFSTVGIHTGVWSTCARNDVGDLKCWGDGGGLTPADIWLDLEL